MSGFGDGIGTVIEGGLLGRAVESAHGEAAETTHGPAECANCTAEFAGHYCPECGQKAQIHRSLAAIGHDIMHGVLHLDGKLWNTLPLLAFKPGDLTRRYIAGERAKFVSPMSMFLFTVFAMFAVFQVVGISPSDDIAEGWGNYSSDSSGKGVFRDNIQRQITELEEERDGIPETDPRREAIDGELTIIRNMIGEGAVAIGSKSADIKVTGIGFLDDGIIKKWQQNPSLMFYKLQSNGYKFSWLLIPLSVPFVWLMFAWRRQFKAYDHAVFVTYSLSFMSLLFIVMSLLGLIPGEWGAAIAFFPLVIGAPLHLYKQLRYAYGLTRFSAFWRFCVMLVCMQIVLVLFLQALLVLGAF
jgi:hypothetical protein